MTKFIEDTLPEVTERVVSETARIAGLRFDDVKKNLSSEPKGRLFSNDVYIVLLFERGQWFHLAIGRRDRDLIHTWSDLQTIKNEIIGTEFEAVELYPAESRRVDSANQYHLWGFRDETFRFPFGFDSRLIVDTNRGK